jgi:hypothetical protein
VELHGVGFRRSLVSATKLRDGIPPKTCGARRSSDRVRRSCGFTFADGEIFAVSEDCSLRHAADAT